MAQFLERLESLGPEAETAKDPEIVRLVTSYTWHAVPQAIEWLDATDPRAEREPEDPTPETLRVPVHLIAILMAREVEAPGFLEMLEVVSSWRKGEWQSYWDARRLTQEAMGLRRKRDWAAAKTKLREAAARFRSLGRIHWEAGTTTNAGTCEFYSGQFSEATQLFEHALTLRSRLGNEADIAASLTNLGMAFRNLGRFEDALDRTRRAFELFAKIGNEAHLAVCLNNLGNITYSLAQYEEALAHHSRALALKQKFGNEAGIANSYMNLSNVFHALGRYEDALTYQHRALMLSRKTGREISIAGSCSNLACILTDIGRYEDALALHRRALELRQKLGNMAEVAVSLTGLGSVFSSLEQYEEALDHERRALQIFEKIGNVASIAASLGNLGNILAHLGEYEESLGHHRRALELREKIGNETDIATSLNNVGSDFHELGRYEEALDCHGRALALRERIGNQVGTATSLHNIGLTMTRLGRVGEAREHFSRSLDKVRCVREDLLADRDRLAFVETLQGRIVPVLEAVFAGEAMEDLDSDAPLALRALETLRGMATADLLQASVAGVELAEAADAAAGVQRIEHELEALERRVRETYEQTGPAKARAEALRQDLQARQRELEKQWQDAVDRLRRESPEWASLKRPEPIALDEICALLPEKTAYVAFALGGDSSFLLLVDHDGLQHWRLEGEEMIETAVRQHLELLATDPGTGPGLGSIVESGRQLYDLLLAPAEEALQGYRTLLVSAEGLLWGLPLETLVTGGEGTDPRTAPYLLEKHAIVYVHSASVWGIHGERRKERRAAYASGHQTRPTKTLVLADPLVPGEAVWQGNAPLVLEYAARRSEPIGRLPFTRVEGFSVATSLADLEEGTWRFTVDGQRQDAAEFLARLETLRAPGAARDVVLTGPGLELRVGAPASQATLTRQRLEDVRFLHLATHAHLDESSPGLSGMWLSPVGEQDSGFLRLSDVMDLGLRAELVTLSGCETALGKATVSEGYQGLVRAFLFAGAENVLASAWRVDDAASAALLSGLYQSLRTGDASAAEAVQQMKRDYLRRVPAATPEKAHPYYWGAWMLWGIGLEAER